ncbi:T-cell surface glycoprotein CD3 zeta chain-like isoform X2 [Conger conger]|nr:T-cell surface glycoprotein CD3 zeta chain-like isoform X2 [Conger conger]
MLCYILDGVLLLYGLFITALFFRERYFKRQATSKDDGIYMGLSKAADTYDVLSTNAAESGAAALRGNRRRTGDETYTALQKPTDDDYKEIGVKKERRKNEKKEQVYQGLSSPNRATYDTLHMQQLPSRK